MKNVIFDKKHLQEIYNMDKLSPREYWNVAVASEREDGLVKMTSISLFNLLKGANKNDPWSSCETARILLQMDKNRNLPFALSYYHRALLTNDNGAVYDFEHLNFQSLIESYSSQDSLFSEMIVKCALFADYYLLDSGRTKWEDLSTEEKKKRIEILVRESCHVLRLNEVNLNITRNTSFGNYVNPRGVASPDEWKLSVLESVLSDFEDLIVVIYHELGHFVTYKAYYDYLKGSFDYANIFGYDETRIKSWWPATFCPGYSGSTIPTSEEDPDTLSYNVLYVYNSLFKIKN